MGGGKPGKHKIQGIGAGFIPRVMNLSIVDEVIGVKDEDAFEMCRSLAKQEGILVGVSSGAAAYAAVSIARRKESKGKLVVVILPDGGEKYLSMGLFT